MTAFDKGIQLYLLGLASIATLTIVWGTNAFLLDNVTNVTAWPLMIGITGMFVALGVLVHRLRAANDSDPSLSSYPWSNNDRG